MNAMQHSQLLQVYNMYLYIKKKSQIFSGLELKCPPLLLSCTSSEKLTKSSQPTLESSSIQTAEPIVKCHCTVLYCKKILCARGRGVVAGGGGV